MARLGTLKPRVEVLRTNRAAPEKKEAAPIYRSAQWRDAREQAIGLAFGFCAHCGRRPQRLFVDHIVELKDGGAEFEQSNLEALCGSCHSIKTAKARAQRMAKVERRSGDDTEGRR